MDILLSYESLERVSDDLRGLPVRAVSWARDGSLTVDGQSVAPTDVHPEVGWISFDVFKHGQMAPYIEALCQFESVRWVQTGNAGLDNPLYRPLINRGIRISKSWAQSIPIAEYVLGYALHHFHDIDARVTEQRSGKWTPAPFRELYKTRWLIIGFGHIGRRVALRAKAFDCHVTALRRSPSPTFGADEVIGRDELYDTLARTDVIVLACPQTRETTGMVNHAFLDAMKEGALLVNVARGGLIDDEALLKNLNRSKPGAAVLDVFNEEPLPNHHPYWTHPNVIVTAHMSNAGNGTNARGALQFLDNLRAYVKGEPITDEVDVENLLD